MQPTPTFSTVADDLARRDRVRQSLLLLLLAFTSHALLALFIMVDLLMWSIAVRHLPTSALAVVTQVSSTTVALHLVYVLTYLWRLGQSYGHARS